jgi:hypothetical protein
LGQVTNTLFSDGSSAINIYDGNRLVVEVGTVVSVECQIVTVFFADLLSYGFCLVAHVASQVAGHVLPVKQAQRSHSQMLAL